MHTWHLILSTQIIWLLLLLLSPISIYCHCSSRVFRHRIFSLIFSKRRIWIMKLIKISHKVLISTILLVIEEFLPCYITLHFWIFPLQLLMQIVFLFNLIKLFHLIIDWLSLSLLLSFLCVTSILSFVLITSFSIIGFTLVCRYNLLTIPFPILCKQVWFFIFRRVSCCICWLFIIGTSIRI